MNNFQKTLAIIQGKTLNEMAPPPEDWDLKTFDKSFAAQIRYAKEKAATIGTGSSRVAFVVPYQGRDTVLKIAKNKKGLAQNEKEADRSLYRYYSSITIPLIDYDQEHEQPTWIHFEKAEKMKPSDFKKATGFSFKDFSNVLNKFRMEVQDRVRRLYYNPVSSMDSSLVSEIEESEIYSDVTSMAMDYDLKVGDFTRTANWGMYKGNPVIIDLGFDSSVYELYYNRK